MFLQYSVYTVHTVGGKDGGDGGDGGGGSAKHGKATMGQDCMTRGQENRSRGQKNWFGTSKKIKVRGSKNQGSKKHGGGQRNNLVGQVCQESKKVLKCKESFLVTGSRPKWQYAAVSWYFGSRNAKGLRDGTRTAVELNPEMKAYQTSKNSYRSVAAR